MSKVSTFISKEEKELFLQVGKQAEELLKSSSPAVALLAMAKAFDDYSVHPNMNPDHRQKCDQAFNLLMLLADQLEHVKLP